MSPSACSGVRYKTPFEVLWEDGERIVCRTRRDDPRQSVLIVLPAAEHPTPGTLRRLANEYGVILNLMINAVEAMSGDGGGRANCSSARPRLSRTCLSQCGFRSQASLQRTSIGSLSPSTRRSPVVSGSGYRSAARSSKHMADDCGRARMSPGARRFNSHCLSAPDSLSNDEIGTYDSNPELRV
jgi:hypothetical protein